jgi:hypothetical protein
VVSTAAASKSPFINIIDPPSQWDNGIPPVMGAHLMASGTVAPVSTSKGAGEQQRAMGVWHGQFGWAAISSSSTSTSTSSSSS